MGRRDTEDVILGLCGMRRNCASSVCLFVLSLAFPWALFLLLFWQEGSRCAPPSGQNPLVLVEGRSPRLASSALCKDEMVNDKGLLSSLSGELSPGFLNFSLLPLAQDL